MRPSDGVRLLCTRLNTDPTLEDRNAYLGDRGLQTCCADTAEHSVLQLPETRRSTYSHNESRYAGDEQNGEESFQGCMMEGLT